MKKIQNNSTSTSLAIDTGSPRHVVGHFVSGSLAAGVASGAMNYQKLKNEEIDKKEFISNTARVSAQGGIATASAISAANYMGKGNWLGVFASVGVGALGLYATTKLYDKIDAPKDEKTSKEEK